MNQFFPLLFFLLFNESFALYRLDTSGAQFYHSQAFGWSETNNLVANDDPTVPSYDGSNSQSLFKMTISFRADLRIIADYGTYIFISSVGIATPESYDFRSNGDLHVSPTMGLNYLLVVPPGSIGTVNYSLTIQQYFPYETINYNYVLSPGQTGSLLTNSTNLSSCQFVPFFSDVSVEFNTVGTEEVVYNGSVLMVYTNPSFDPVIFTYNCNNDFLLSPYRGRLSSETTIVGSFPTVTPMIVDNEFSFVGTMNYIEFNYSSEEVETIIRGDTSLQYKLLSFGGGPLPWNDPFSECWNQIYSTDGTGLPCRTGSDCYSGLCNGTCIANDTYLLDCLNLTSMIPIETVPTCIGAGSMSWRDHYYYASTDPLVFPELYTHSRWLSVPAEYTMFSVAATNSSCNATSGNNTMQCYFGSRTFPVSEANCTTICEDPVTGVLQFNLTEEQCLNQSSNLSYCRGLSYDQGSLSSGCYFCADPRCTLALGPCTGIVLNSSDLYNETACTNYPMMCSRYGYWSNDLTLCDGNFTNVTQWFVGSEQRNRFYQPTWGDYIYPLRWTEMRYDYSALSELVNREATAMLWERYYQGPWQWLLLSNENEQQFIVEYRNVTITPWTFVSGYEFDSSIVFNSTEPANITIDGTEFVLPYSLNLAPAVVIVVPQLNVPTTTYSTVVNNSLIVDTTLTIKGDLVVNGTLTVNNGNVTIANNLSIPGGTLVIGDAPIHINGCANFTGGNLVLQTDQPNITYKELCGEFSSVQFSSSDGICQTRSVDYGPNELTVLESFSCTWTLIVPICIGVVVVAVVLIVVFLKVRKARRWCVPNRDRTTFERSRTEKGIPPIRTKSTDYIISINRNTHVGSVVDPTVTS